MADGFQRQRMSSPVKLILAGAAAAAMAYAVRQRRRMDFEGKIVVIAGASRGLGLELARGFAKEGACVVLLARDRSKLAEIAAELEAVGASVAVLGCDITQQDEVRSNIESVIREFKRIDVLINVAGIIQVGPSEHMQLEDFAEAMAVHFWGPLYLMKRSFPTLNVRAMAVSSTSHPSAAKSLFRTCCPMERANLLWLVSPRECERSWPRKGSMSRR